MIATEIVKRMSPELFEEACASLYSKNRDAYRTVVELVATRRKLRPIFLERKPRAERHAWIKTALTWSPNESLAGEMLQAWLLGSHQAMICEFLDVLGVVHDDKGLFEALPEEPDLPKLRSAVGTLMARYSREMAIVYLEIFSEMASEKWMNFRQLIREEGCVAPEVPTAAA